LCVAGGRAREERATARRESRGGISQQGAWLETTVPSLLAHEVVAVDV